MVKLLGRSASGASATAVLVCLVASSTAPPLLGLRRDPPSVLFPAVVVHALQPPPRLLLRPYSAPHRSTSLPRRSTSLERRHAALRVLSVHDDEPDGGDDDGPSASSTTSKALAVVPKEARHKVGKLATELVPPIPARHSGSSSTLLTQFRPRFVAREFLLGARYMCDVLPLLHTGMVVGHASRCLLAYATTGSAVISTEAVAAAAVAGGSAAASSASEVTRVTISAFHVLENRMKLAATASMVKFGVPLNAVRAVLDVVVGPIAEEISYRGVAQGLAAFFARVDILWHAFLCRFSVNLATILVAVETLRMVIGSIGKFVRKEAGLGPIPTLSLIAGIVSLALLIPPKLAIMRFMRPENASARLMRNTTQPQNAQDLAPSQASKWADPNGVRGVIAKTVDGNNSTAHKNVSDGTEWQDAVDVATSRFARWTGAVFFGAAHGGGGGDQFSDQKVFGTIVSSLLVESRLVANRRTLWGAFGAHIMFNAIGHVSPLHRLIGAAFADPKRWLAVPIALFFHFDALRRCSIGLKWAEKQLH